MQETLQDETLSRDREKDSAIQAADDRVAALQDERDSLLARAQSEQRLRITELTQRFGVSLQDMEINIRETIRQEITAEKIQEMARVQKKCSKDVEAARLEERAFAARELEELRKTYAEREAQTSEDLAELEKLHGNRVFRLEAQVAALRGRAEAAEARMNEAVLELNRAVEESRGGNERHLQQLEEYARRADALAVDLDHAHTEIQESRVREMSYREQLTRVLEEARVRHAELAELRRQSADRSAQAGMWRRAASEIDVTQAATTTQLQIAREEVAMLEHELHRAKDENAGLRRALGSADRLVYGVFSPYSHLAPQGPLGLSGSSGPHGYTEEDDSPETHRGGTYADPTASSSSKSPRMSSSGIRSARDGSSRRAGAAAMPMHSKMKLIQHPPWRPGFW
jgi:hypothetical protein